MERRLVGMTMVLAPLALAVAAMAAGYSAIAPSWWEAAVRLAVLGGITPMIYAVNVRIVPLYSRRQWPSLRLVLAQVAAGVAGAWLAFLGTGLRSTAWTGIGEILALAGGVLFLANVRLLFRQPAAPRPMPSATPSGTPSAMQADQAGVDKTATMFTRIAGVFLQLGLILGVALVWWHPASGRWDLVWAHTMLIGFFLSMASGVCYHTLSRWSKRPWPFPKLVRWHYRLVVVGLPLMLLALATDTSWLFLIAGSVQALALALLIVNCVPLVIRLERPVRAGILAAGSFLVVGVTLGVIFAIDPAMGARLRQVHALANLFGWGGLLVSGFGYAFVPQFAGAGLRWPRLAPVQLGVLAIGIAAGILAFAWRALGDGPDEAVMAAQAIVGVGLALFAVQVAATFLGPRPTAAVVRPMMRTAPSR